MKTLRALTLVLAFVLCIPASAVANCGSAADRDPAAPSASLRAARSATLCLLNRERGKQHLRPLRSNHRLALAGLRHARDMVRNDYFAHDAPSGQSFVDRIMKTDYVPTYSRWFLGENLAWGDEEGSTPRSIVHSWMASPAHRKVILTGRFRQVGVAIVGGAPVDGTIQAATYATEFGAIHRY
jgi:uncharacterized protein YkwD